MKVLIFSFLALCFFWKTDKIELIQSYSQDWIAGVPDGNNGTNYMFSIKVLKSSEHLMFDELWIGDEKVPFRLFTDIHTTGNTSFAKNDTIFIRGQIIADNSFIGQDKKTNEPESSDATMPSPPFEYIGEALIVYSYRGRQKYLVVKDIEKKKSQIRP